METPISLSVLLTESDYMLYVEQSARERRQNSRGFFAVVGGLLTLIGAAGALLGERRTAGWMLTVAVLGVLVLLYDRVFAPIFDRTNAVSLFRERDSLRTSSVYVFEDDCVRVRTAFAEGALPYAALTDCAETESLFSFDFGREMQLLIPKRLLTEPQEAGLRAIAQQRGEAAI